MKPTLAPASQRRCANCLGAVSGQYCAHCGQRHKSVRRHFRQLASDFFNDVLNLDTKLLNTLKPLLFKPGFLSTEYFADRRMRYVSPLKLYFILSIVAFFLVQLSVDINGQNGGLITVNKAKADGSPVANEKPMTEEEFSGPFNFGSGPWHAKKNPMVLTWLPQAGNDLINARIARLDSTIRNRDWNGLVHAALSAAPPALLIMLPFFALILKLMYIRSHRLYMEHLIIALHNHAFLLLAIALMIVTSGLALWLLPLTARPAGEMAMSLALSWIPLYFLLSLKRIYRQGWRKTVLKFCLIGFCYIFMICLVAVLIALLGIIMI
jgi:Protein of unknown function (DUF3667)